MNTHDETIARKLDLAENGAISVKEAARLLGVSRSLLYAMMETGKLAYARIGRRRVIPRKAIQEVLAENIVVR